MRGGSKRYYLKVSTVINDRIEIEKHYDARYGAPGVPRENKKERTPEEMARQNLWRRKRDLRRLMELNFKGGDWHVTLTCRPEERPTREEAPAVIRKFRDQLRGAYKKQGWELKYIITCEVGERGAVHWHMIVNNRMNGETSTSREISRLWKRGRPKFVPLDENRQYGQLAEYIVKSTQERIQNGKTIEKLSYMISRNMKKPKVHREKIPARSWKKEPVPQAGYRVVPDSVVNGINKYTGWPYQYYTLERIGKEGSG